MVKKIYQNSFLKKIPKVCKRIRPQFGTKVTQNM